jgi:enoyl-CoA hydratase/carnithine racemase/uncharacterized protein YndB with AHSA1/START domain
MSESFRTSIEIAASQEEVFDYFVKPELLVRWMGDVARLDATAGGTFSVDINGVLIRGHYVRLERPRLIEIAWGEAGNAAMPPGATRLVVTLSPDGPGTRVTLEHTGLTAAEAKKHTVGWPHFIERLAVAAGGGDPGPDPWQTEGRIVEGRQMADAVRYEAQDRIGVITLNRPDRNSMTPELLDAFAHASAAARSDAEIRALVITGTGSSFSAGADFKAGLQRGSDDLPPAERSYAMYEPFLSLLEVEVPIIGALNGHAIGGGFGLALVCDLRIAALEGKYGANFVALGLAPGMAISHLLPRLVGLPRASELLFTGRLVDGAEAERLGIVNRAVPAAQVLEESLALARAIAANAPFAVRATKAAIRRSATLDVRAAARAEAVDQAASLAMQDAREGMSALLEKRKPVFTGR